jgi:hypothetical protein
MLRCAELGLHSDDLEDLSIGMVMDMLTEKGNDHEKYDIKAPGGSMRSFFNGTLNLGE